MGIFSTPGKSVCVNQFYLPFITGALELLAIDDLWEAPAGVVPEIEKLIAAFNEPAGDCTELSTEYCSAWDFSLESHSDVWEGKVSFQGGSAAVWTELENGYVVDESAPCAGCSVTVAIHAHFDIPITINSVDICYQVVSHSSNSASSRCDVHAASSDSGSGTYYSSGDLAVDFSGCHTVVITPTTSQDWMFRAYVNPTGGGETPSANIVIHGINIFGSGDAPSGGSLCG